MLNNNFGEEGANAIVDVVKGNPQLNTLCGIKPDLTEADFSIRGLRVGDAILLAFDLKKNSVLIKLKCVHSLRTTGQSQQPLTIRIDSRSQPRLQ